MVHPSGGGGREASVLPVPAPLDIVKILFSTDDDALERRGSLMHYVQPNEAEMPIMEIQVPGDDRKYLKRSNRARRGTCALVAWFCKLHDLGYFLNGKFTVEDFSVDPLGNLRGNKSLLPLLMRFTETRMVAIDMVVVAGIIKTDIHLGLENLPADLVHLLKQLEEHDISCSPLIMNHASHDHEDIKTALFCIMFRRLKEIEASDSAKYQSIMQQMIRIPNVAGWLDRAMANTHLHAFLRQIPTYMLDSAEVKRSKTLKDVLLAFLEEGVHYSGNITGLLEFRQNGLENLEIEYSIDTVGNIEAGLFGASEGMKVWHLHQQQQHHHHHQTQQWHHHQQAQWQHHHKQQPQQLKPVIVSRALWIAQTISKFLVGANMSLAAAKAGAAAVATYIATADAGNMMAESEIAIAAGQLAAATHGGAAQAGPPYMMFDGTDIDHMFDIIAPDLLVGFQKIMYESGECFRLGKDTRVPQLIA